MLLSAERRLHQCFFSPLSVRSVLVVTAVSVVAVVSALNTAAPLAVNSAREIRLSPSVSRLRRCSAS